MTDWLRKLGRALWLPAFYGVALLTCLYLTLPTEQLRQRLLAEANAGRGPSDVRVEIDEVSTYWLSGLELSGVRLISPAPTAAAEDAASSAAPAASAASDGAGGASAQPPPPRDVVIETVTVRASLLRLLVGSLHLSFSLDGLGGSVRGSYRDDRSEKAVEAELHGISLGQLPPLRQALGVPVEGALDGSLQVVLPEGKLSKAEGEVALELSELALGDGKAKVMSAITLPRLEVGTMTLSGKLVEGRLELEKVSAAGRDLDLELGGKVRLREPLSASVAELTARFKVSEKYKDKNEMTRSIFGAPGSKITPLIEMDPKVRRSKRPDGSYAWRISGPLAHLVFEPGAAATVGGATPARPRLVGPTRAAD